MSAPVLSAREQRAWALLRAVPDPEIPVLSIVDLGIVRHVREDSAGCLHVGITPTYSGCPATEVIRAAVAEALRGGGLMDAVLEEILSPPWSSSWLTPEGRQKLRGFGIAPPQEEVARPGHLWRAPNIRCPRCSSPEVQCVSEFGSTPCKAHYRCLACQEPFDYFKCI